MPGRFITLEGGEGAGKSTQVRRLADKLKARGLDVVTTREPGGSPLAERYREVLLSGKAKPYGSFGEAVLFSGARIDHLDQLIRPALARGAYVICDRFADSTRVYQGAVGDVSVDVLKTLERVTLGATRPHLTLILDLPPELGLARAHARRHPDEEADRFEAEGLAFHTKLRKGFLAIAEAEPQRCVVIDASRAPDEVEQLIWDAVTMRLLG